MSKDRPPITARMKVNCLLERIHQQFGAFLRDFEGNELKPGDPVVFDHVHGLAFGGPHTYQAIRPCLKSSNDRKARREGRDARHVKRLTQPKARKGPTIPRGQFGPARGIQPNSFTNRGRA